jgi:antitoxin component of MazEF toxin-antitoxin module
MIRHLITAVRLNGCGLGERAISRISHDRVEAMRVTRWGKSLGVRFPKRLVDEMGISEGDEIIMLVAGDGRFEFIKRERRPEAAVEEPRRAAEAGGKRGRGEGKDR